MLILNQATSRNVWRALAVASVLLAAGCVGGSTDPERDTFTVTPSPLLFIGPGRNATLTASDAGGSRIDPLTLTWRSDKPAVVSINQSGIARSEAPGEGNITVLGGAFSVRVPFVVLDAITIPPQPPAARLGG